MQSGGGDSAYLSSCSRPSRHQRQSTPINANQRQSTPIKVGIFTPKNYRLQPIGGTLSPDLKQIKLSSLGGRDQ
jgi:hypothetical protein